MKKRNRRIAALFLVGVLQIGTLFPAMPSFAEELDANSQVITGTRDSESAEGVTGTKDIPFAQSVTGIRGSENTAKEAVNERAKESKEEQNREKQPESMNAQETKSYLDAISGYLLETVEDPACGSVGGEWAVIGLARYGSITQEFAQTYLNNLYAYIEKKEGELSTNKYTEYSRVILALTALGEDITQAAGYDLTAPLARLEKVCFQGANGPIWALIALDSKDYSIPDLKESEIDDYTQTTRENLIAAVLKGRNKNGVWESSGAEADMTGMAIQALANYYDQEHPDVMEAVDHALEWLSALQQADGSFGSSESDAQVLVALCAMGIPVADERFVKNGNTVLDGMMSYYLDNEHAFEHVHGEGANGMATEQGMYALTAYYRFVTGQTWLYDMSDVEMTQDPTISAEEFLQRVEALPNIVHLQDREEVEFLVRELERQVGIPNQKEIAEKLANLAEKIQKLKQTVEQLGQDIWKQIDPARIDLTDQVMVEYLQKRYESLDETDRSYVAYREDLLAAVSIVENLQKGIIPKAVFDNIRTTGETFWYHGMVSDRFSYTLKINGNAVENPVDMKAGMAAENKLQVRLEGSKLAFSMAQEGILPSKVTVDIHTDLAKGTYYVYRRDPGTSVMKAIAMVECENGELSFSTKAGGDFQIVSKEAVDQADNPALTVFKTKQVEKQTQTKEAKIETTTISSNTLTVENLLVRREEFERIKGKEESYQAVCKTEDGVEYSFTFYGTDIVTLKDFNTGLTFDSENRTYIEKLTEDFVLLHFEQEGTFPGQALVEVNIEKEDGDYLLFWYDEEKMQAEYVQKVEIKENKTKFILEKGGDYFIAKRAKTKSLKEEETVEDQSPEIEEKSVMPTSVEEKETLNYWQVGAGVAVLLLVLGGAYLVIRRRRK